MQRMKKNRFRRRKFGSVRVMDKDGDRESTRTKPDRERQTERKKDR